MCSGSRVGPRTRVELSPYSGSTILWFSRSSNMLCDRRKFRKRRIKIRESERDIRYAVCRYDYLLCFWRVHPRRRSRWLGPYRIRLATSAVWHNMSWKIRWNAGEIVGVRIMSWRMEVMVLWTRFSPQGHASLASTCLKLNGKHGRLNS